MFCFENPISQYLPLVQKNNEGSSGRWAYDIWLFWGKCKLKVSQVAILLAEDYSVSFLL
jgi:hypothetical protein